MSADQLYLSFDASRTMRRTAGACNDGFEAFGLGFFGELEEPIGGAVRRDDLGAKRHLELTERVRRVLHGGQVRAAAHDDGDERLHGAVLAREGPIRNKVRGIDPESLLSLLSGQLARGDRTAEYDFGASSPMHARI